LHQKEGYSAYIFEHIAAEFLAKNQEIQKLFENKLKNDAIFARNPRAQLDFIYKNTTL
jgi:endonuclease III-like uncharacterized protein